LKAHAAGVRFAFSPGTFMRPNHFLLTLTLLLSAAAFAQTTPTDNPEAAKARAREVLKQAREALGDADKLAALKSLQIQGDFKGMRAGRPSQGDFKIELLLPDKFMRTARTSMGPMEMTMIQAVNGPDAWFDMKQSMSMGGGSGMGDAGGMGGGGGGGMGGGGGGMGGGGGGMGGGGMGGGGGRRGGGMGGGMPGGGMGGPGGGLRGISPEMEDTMKKEARDDFSRLLLGVLLLAPSAQFEFSYDQTLEAKDGKADVLRITGPNEFQGLLLVDQQSHRPRMLAYRAPAQRAPRRPGGAPGAPPPIDEEAEGPKMADYQLFFMDHKQVDNLWFPQRIVKASGNQMVEEWKLNKFKLNPDLKPSRFEKKK
jgi:hypothetical protein